ncbi:MAG: arginase [Betaproteobacteria bacterium]|nr:arginase [Betaproteobacteria bacterium]
MRRPRIEIIGAASGHGAPDPRCGDAPAALQAAGLLPRLRAAGLDAVWRATVKPTTANARTPLTAVMQMGRDLARHTAASIARDCMPLVLGGDHSCAIGTWKGVAQATTGPLGLIWIDAHMDAHTNETTESGRLHGMPLACLLGHGDPELVGIANGARLEPQNVCLVGIRSYEAGEAALLERLGVRIFTMREIRQRGLAAVMADAREIASTGTAGYGISVDLDAIDPHDAPGVGSPVKGGLKATDLLGALAELANDPTLRALEIVEYNPYLDCGAQTIALVPAIAEALLSPQRMLEFALR